MSANDQGRLDLPAPASRQELVQRLLGARIETRKNWGVYVEMQAQVRRQMSAGTERLIEDVYRRRRYVETGQ